MKIVGSLTVIPTYLHVTSLYGVTQIHWKIEPQNFNSSFVIREKCLFLYRCLFLSQNYHFILSSRRVKLSLTVRKKFIIMNSLLVHVLQDDLIYPDR